MAVGLLFSTLLRSVTEGTEPALIAPPFFCDRSNQVSEDVPRFAPDDSAAVECYRQAFRTLQDAEIPFLVGGAYSFAQFSGIPRHTKDLDLFIRPDDRDRALAALQAAGFETEVAFDHWLAKARRGEYFIDLIYGAGSGIAVVDDGWFKHAVEANVMNEAVWLCPAEESIWSKAFVMERHRFDGADIVHILRRVGPELDWQRLLDRFGDHWQLLYCHLVLFTFVYPNERDRIPAWVQEKLSRQMVEGSNGSEAGRVCRGTLLSAIEYLPDIERWGYRDSRLTPTGNMTPGEVEVWTEGVLEGK